MVGGWWLWVVVVLHKTTSCLRCSFYSPNEYLAYLQIFIFTYLSMFGVARRQNHFDICIYIKVCIYTYIYIYIYAQLLAVF